MLRGADVELAYEFNRLSERHRQKVISQVNGIIEKSHAKDPIESIWLEFHKVYPVYFGKNLIFCNVSLNMTDNIITEYGSGWTVKKAVRNALKRALINANKIRRRDEVSEYITQEALNLNSSFSY